MPKLKNLPTHQMPREKLIAQGPDNLKDHELLAIILGTGIKGLNVLELSKQIFKKHPLKTLLTLKYEDLLKIKGINTGKATTLLSSFELIKRALEVQDNNLPTIKSARDAVNQLQDIKNRKREHLVALYLNARNQLIEKKVISIGTVNASMVHPREVYHRAVENLAAQIIIAHNHPSGTTEPSPGDHEVTRRLKESGDIMGIELSDHIIMTNNSYLSFKEEGIL